MTRIALALAVVGMIMVVRPAVVDAGCESSQSFDASTWQSCNSDTAGAANGCYGRCGPACNWSNLGNVYTSACQTHDWCVRSGLSAGRSTWSAHANCVSSLGSAARSWYSVNWHSWKGKIRDKVSGFISNWL